MADRYAEMIRRLRGMPGPMGQSQMELSSGMTDPYVTQDMLEAQAIDLSGPERSVARQQAVADQLRGSEAPQGRTVGPSNIYVAPNWGDTLGYAAKQVAGGYLGKKANEADQALQGQRLEKALGKLQADNAQWQAGENRARRNEGRLDRGFDYRVGRDTSDADYRAKRDAKSDAQWAAEYGLSLDALTDGDVETFNIGGKPVTVSVDSKGRGRRYLEDGSLGAPVDISGAKPWHETTVAATTAEMEDALAREADPTRGEGVTRPDVVVRVLDSDVMDVGTGALDPQRWAGVLGYGPKGAEVQDLQRDMGTALISGIGSNLEALNLKPVSDTDRKLLASDVPTANTQPYGWTGWAANTYRPLLSEKFDDAIKSGVHTEESKTDYLNQLDISLAKRAIKSGYPLSKLREAGVSPKIIEYFELEAKENGS